MTVKSLSVATAEWFSKLETQAVFGCLNKEGFEARAVGGAVRNALLREPVTEVDFATTATPEDTLRLAGEAGIRTIPTGIEHGTVTLVVGGATFEVTSLRTDLATDGRRATVAFGQDWAADARRRDFTINALYADRKGDVHDPLGGLADLFARRVRFVGDAAARIREDYLRILRFFRFSAQYAQGEFDRDGVAAAIRERRGLRQLSRERVRSEFLRILVSRRTEDAVEIMDESGLLLLLLGGVTRRKRFERVCSIERMLSLPPDPIYRLAALALFVEEDAQRFAGNLRLSVHEANALLALASALPRLSPELGKNALEAALYRSGPYLYLGRILLAWAASEAEVDNGAWTLAADLSRGWERPKFPIGGADFLERSWKSGPKLGAKLSEIEDRWIESGFSLSREALLDLIPAAGGVELKPLSPQPPPPRERGI